jgi:hypothetical protein
VVAQRRVEDAELIAEALRARETREWLDLARTKPFLERTITHLVRNE